MCGPSQPPKVSKAAEAANAPVKEKVQGYSLADAEAAHRRNPAIFRIPSLRERTNLGKGIFAKLIFNPGERMWVEVTQVSGGPIYVGKLVSTPAVLTSMKVGDEIEFSPHHVCGVEYKTDEKARKRLALER